MKKIKLGVIADDFTGAGDAASFLKKGGNQTVLLTSVPDSFDAECDCIVVATKIRSVEAETAVEEVKKIADFFDRLGVVKIYYKYCSTFDSTPKGNIGPVMDYLLERTDSRYTVLCPSLPVNGRKVKDGCLFVNGVPLSESPLKNHPLNPMWDSFIPTLMEPQSKNPCYVVTREDLSSSAYKRMINESDEESRFYLVPDYETDEDGVKISEAFKDLKLLSGGSGLLEHLFACAENTSEADDFDVANQKAIIVCGSCSAMTNRQVQAFKKTENKSYAISADDLINGLFEAKAFFEKAKDELPKYSLIYSDGCERKPDQNDPDLITKSRAMEDFLSDIAMYAGQAGFNKIIVAGGETSGAATIKLGYKAFYVGESVAPGVPVLIPLEDQSKRVILKSGNFVERFF